MTRAVVGRFVLSLAIIGFTHAQLWGQQAQVTRETLVAAAERGPGPTKGREDAPITMVEFSDFQCSFCRKFWKETLPRIVAEYTETGKVRFLYRHFVALGPASAGAAEAAECAGEQGKFWPYHDLLFERAGAFAEGKLKAYAGELGLEPKAFDACLASGRHQERIVAESSIARSLGASGTPAFLVNGRLLIGAHPFSTFKAILDAALARVSEKASVGRSTSPPAAPASKP
jgi:protein-disulfide isomerase